MAKVKSNFSIYLLLGFLATLVAPLPWIICGGSCHIANPPVLPLIIPIFFFFAISGGIFFLLAFIFYWASFSFIFYYFKKLKLVVALIIFILVIQLLLVPLVGAYFRQYNLDVQNSNFKEVIEKGGFCSNVEFGTSRDEIIEKVGQPNSGIGGRAGLNMTVYNYNYMTYYEFSLVRGRGCQSSDGGRCLGRLDEDSLFILDRYFMNSNNTIQFDTCDGYNFALYCYENDALVFKACNGVGGYQFSEEYEGETVFVPDLYVKPSISFDKEFLNNL